MGEYSLEDWLRDLARELELVIDMPHTMNVNGRAIPTVARIRGIGGPSGMLVVTPATNLSPVSSQLSDAGYGWATLDARTTPFDLGEARDVLRDWGWAGDPTLRPAWFTQDYPSDWDCAWLASDGSGHLGAFITAGEGPIPGSILDLAKPVVEWEGIALELPRISEAVELKTTGDTTSYVALAERGLFVYDWLDVHRLKTTGKYEMVARPVRPLRVAEIESDLRVVVDSVRFGGIEFSSCNAIDVPRQMPCVIPPPR